MTPARWVAAILALLVSGAVVAYALWSEIGKATS